MVGDEGNEGQTRQERRERRQRKRREMQKHGANLGALYGNAVVKRLAEIGHGSGAKRRRRRRA